MTTYGTDADAQIRAVDIEMRGRNCRFRVRARGEDLGELSLGVTGYHNIRNALAATTVRCLKMDRMMLSPCGWRVPAARCTNWRLGGRPSSD